MIGESKAVSPAFFAMPRSLFERERRAGVTRRVAWTPAIASVAERRWLAMIQRIRNAAMRKRFSSALCRRACRYCPGLNDTCAARNDTCAAHNDWPLTFSRENSRGWGVQRGKVWNHTVSSRMRVANTCLAFENRQFRRAIFPCNWQGAGCNSGCLAS